MNSSSSSLTLAGNLRAALIRTVRRVRTETSAEDLTDGQCSVLGALDRSGPLTPRDLARHDGVRPPSMTRTLTGLAEQGLVRREDDPADGRRVLIHLTEEGRRALGRIRGRRNAWLADRLDDLTAEERSILDRATRILGRIADS